MNLARGLVSARDGNVERRRSRDDRDDTAASGHPIVPALFHAGVKYQHVGAITRHVGQAGNNVAGADIAGVAVSR